MAVTRLAPDGVTLTNLTGTLAAIQDDPDSPVGTDATWLVATANNVNTTAHCTFPTPADPLTSGAGLQEIRVKVRKFSATQSGTPTARIEVYAAGVLTFTGPTVSVTDAIGQIFAFTFDGAGFVPADIEARVVGTTTGGSQTTRNTVDVGAVAWNADTTVAAPPAFSGSGSLSGAGALTASPSVTASAAGSTAGAGAVVGAEPAVTSPPSFVAAQGTFTAAVTQHVPALPAGAAADDILIAYHQSTSSSLTITTPAGWTRLGPNWGASGFRAGTFVRKMQARDTAPTFVMSGSSDLHTVILAYRGAVLPTAAEHVQQDTGSGTVLSYGPGAITTTAANSLEVFAVALDATSTGRTVTSDNADTERYDAQLGPLLLAVYEVNAATVGTLTRTATITGTAQEMGASGVVLSPAAVAGAVTGAGATSGSGSVTSVGAPRASGSASTSGSGAVAGAGTPTLTRNGSTSGTGLLSATSAGTGSGSGATSGSGTVTSTGKPSFSISAGTSGSGTVAAQGKPSVSRNVGVSGSGLLSASGSGAESASGSAALGGSGILVAMSSPRVAATASLFGLGQIAGVGSAAEGMAASAALAGAGSLTGSARVSYSSNGSSSGSGSLTTQFSTGVTVKSNVNMFGSGNISATTVPVIPVSASLFGHGLLVGIRAVSDPVFIVRISGPRSRPVDARGPYRRLVDATGPRSRLVDAIGP